MNEINYVMLLGNRYLKSGQNIDNFLKGRFVGRIVRFLKRIPSMKKVVKKVGVKKRVQRKSRVDIDKLGKTKDKIVAEFIAENKVKKHQNWNQFISKSIIEDLIRMAV
jgi:hypothetical protein